MKTDQTLTENEFHLKLERMPKLCLPPNLDVLVINYV